MSPVTGWHPERVIGPVEAGFQPAAAELVKVAQALAPRRTGALAAGVQFVQTGPTAGLMRDNVPYAAVVEKGARPHEITAGGSPMPIGKGRFAASVQHPGTRARPFLAEAAPAFQGLYVNTVRGLMHLGL
jgi:hypothetical protein